MMNTGDYSILTRFAYLLSLLIFLITAGCSSSDSSTGTTTTTTGTLDASLKNVLLADGVPIQIKFTYTVPGDITDKGDFSLNMAQSLESITLSSSPITKKSGRFETLRLIAYALVKEAFAADPVTSMVTGYISYAGDPNVCSNGTPIGPYSITGMIGSALSSGTTDIELTAPMIDIINVGSFEVCVVTIPPIDAYLTVTDVAVDFEPCAAPTVEVLGHWSGTFSCTNFGEVDAVMEPIDLDITLNSDGSYHYEDSEAAYNGHLCGNTFKFTGGDGSSYTESGTLVFSSSTAATKTSHWNSIPPGNSGGTCSDTLEKDLTPG
jgi:hypothetical protein